MHGVSSIVSLLCVAKKIESMQLNTVLTTLLLIGQSFLRLLCKISVPAIFPSLALQWTLYKKS